MENNKHMESAMVKLLCLFPLIYWKYYAVLFVIFFVLLVVSKVKKYNTMFYVSVTLLVIATTHIIISYAFLGKFLKIIFKLT